MQRTRTSSRFSMNIRGALFSSNNSATRVSSSLACSARGHVCACHPRVKFGKLKIQIRNFHNIRRVLIFVLCANRQTYEVFESIRLHGLANSVCEFNWTHNEIESRDLCLKKPHRE
jgi:hypothetical protein